MLKRILKHKPKQNKKNRTNKQKKEPELEFQQFLGDMMDTKIY